MKAIANTTIRFGLINLPVGICKATGEMEDVKFNLGDSQGRRLIQQYVDPENKVVPSDEQTKLYEGHIIDKDDLATIAEQTKLPDLSVLKIEERERFDAEAYRITGHYFLQSTKKTGNINAYKLFADALKATNKVAVTKFTFRTRQQIVVLWPNEDGILCASTMAFRSDVRAPDENVRAHLAGTYTEAEMDMAKQLFEALGNSETDPLEMETDEAVAKRYALVQQVMAGEPIEKAEKVEVQQANTALADALAQMLAAQKEATVA
jgi:Ku protein